MSKKNYILKMVKALFFSYIITLVLILLSAFIAYQFEFSELFSRVCVIVVYILSCFSGGFMIGHQAKKKQYLWGVILGLIYFIIILLVSVLINKGVLVKPQSVLTVLGMCVLGGMLGGMVS